jgi:hypothetical protein
MKSNVQRINVVEPDGTLRLVLSNHSRLPGVIVRGKERPFARPQAGMLFYNDEGTENGGLVFGAAQERQRGDRGLGWQPFFRQVRSKSDRANCRSRCTNTELGEIVVRRLLELRVPDKTFSTALR